MNVGVHLSLGKNPRLSIAEARAHGATTIQIFASSPGAWKPPVCNERQVAVSREARAEQGVDPLFIHAIYLINLASANPDLVERSKRSLVATLEAGELMGAAGVVTHIGSHAGRGFEAVAPQIADSLVEIMDAASGTVDLLLENSAGAGGIVGAQLEEIAELVELAGAHPRLRVCLDSAHLCGSGWDFGVEGTAARLVGETDRLIGLDRLVLLHANDSKVPVGSHRDRHANVGDGYIGEDGFRALLAQPALRAIPWILETPDLDSRLEGEERYVSIPRLRALVEETSPAGPRPAAEDLSA